MQDPTMISLLKLIKLHVFVCFCVGEGSSKAVGKFEDGYEEYILLLKLRTYLLISLTQHFATFFSFFLMGWFSPLLQVQDESFIY